MDPSEELAALKAEINRRKEELRPLLDRRDRLLDILDGPRVQPVLVYWRHGVREEEPYEPYGNECTVEAAFRMLYAMVENGNGAPVGVTVGGASMTFDDWDAPLEDS